VLGRGRSGVDGGVVLEQEPVPAIGERGGLGRHAVVSNAPWREIEGSDLSGSAVVHEALEQRRNHILGQLMREELGLAEGMRWR
jgi:hypothetical protein